ncbi:ATP-binding protein [Streptomyces sp. NPDC002851]
MNSEITHLLSPTPRGARLARRLTADRFTDWGCHLHTVEIAEQVAAELANNAATHGRVTGRGFRLRLKLSDYDGTSGVSTLRIEVTDTRAEVPVPTSAERPFPHSESGRGLFLVEALADRWGVQRGPVPCKTVWAEIDCLTPASRVPRPGGPSSGLARRQESKNPGKEPFQATPAPRSESHHPRE